MEEIKMKKLIASAAAAMIMALSVVPAFAISVNSPVATTQAETQPTTTNVKKDDNPVSPKTGADSVAAYSAIALTALACGAGTLFAAKKAKK